MTWHIWLYAVSGVCLLLSAGVLLFARVQHRRQHPQDQATTALAVSLRAADVVDQLGAGQLGDDEQFHRWRTVVPHIRRRANAENHTTPTTSKGARS